MSIKGHLQVNPVSTGASNRQILKVKDFVSKVPYEPLKNVFWYVIFLPNYSFYNVTGPFNINCNIVLYKPGSLSTLVF